MAGSTTKTRLICPLTAGEAGRMRQDMLAAAALGADAVELRLDFLTRPADDDELQMLLADAPVEVIVTCRPEREGGRWSGGEQDRLAILTKAAELGASFVDTEQDVPADKRPAGKLIVSHHDFSGGPCDLQQMAGGIDDADAAVTKKVAFAASDPAAALQAFDALRDSTRPALALAMGEAGVITRILARKFAAFGTFAALAKGAESAPGQLTIDELKNLYRWDDIGPATNVYGIIGCPVAHSMSPAIHNAAFAAAGLDAVYVPLRIEPGAENFNRFMDAVAARPWLDLRGLSVTIPHKENALTYAGADNCDELAVQIGAINTITISPDGKLRGDNTDYAAAMDALCDGMGIRREELAGKGAAVVGAGGAARAIVAALVHYKADVTVYNRTFSRAEQLAGEFACKAGPLEAAAGTDAEIIINCTPIGMSPNVAVSPLGTIPPAAKAVFDTIYNPPETELLKKAAAAGCVAISGLEMFANQAVKQFEIWTARPAPVDVMRQVVIERLQAEE